MVLRASTVVTCALAFAACGEEDPGMPTACSRADEAAFERALAAAPGAVRLDGATPISECLRRVRGNAELQSIGLVLRRVAGTLAGRARDAHDPVAATRLGYLVGAARRGAGRSNGVSGELVRRLEQTGVDLDGVPELRRATEAGLKAGASNG